MMAKFDVLLATKEGSGLDSIARLLACARAHPGNLNFGTIAPGPPRHLAAELFKILTGVDAAVAIYRSSPDNVEWGQVIDRIGLPKQ